MIVTKTGSVVLDGTDAIRILKDSAIMDDAKKYMRIDHEDTLHVLRQEPKQDYLDKDDR